MQYFRCKCGKCERWSTDGPGPACSGCDDCKTTYAQRPEDHKPKQGHQLQVKYNRDTGKADYIKCSKCYQRFPLEQKAMTDGS